MTTQQPGSQFHLHMCADIGGEKRNIEVSFERRPDSVGHIGDEAEVIFRNECAMKGVDPKQFYVGSIVYYEAATRNWKPLENVNQLQDYLQLYLHQAIGDKIPPPSGKVTVFPSRPGIGVDKIAEVFRELDVNNTETIDLKELLNAFAAAGIDFNEEAGSKFFEKYNVSGNNGSISWDLFQVFSEMFPKTVETLYRHLRQIYIDEMRKNQTGIAVPPLPTQQPGSQFRLHMCADIGGEKRNIEVSFERRPDSVGHIGDEAEVIFRSECAMKGVDPKQFYVGSIVYYEAATRNWKPLENVNQLQDYLQLYLYQALLVNEVIGDIPPPSGKVTVFPSRPGIGVDKIAEVFRELDVNNTETIDLKELLNAFAAAGIDFNEEAGSKFFEKYNVSGNNCSISWDVFQVFSEMFPKTVETLYRHLRQIEIDKLNTECY